MATKNDRQRRPLLGPSVKIDIDPPQVDGIHPALTLLQGHTNIPVDYPVRYCGQLLSGLDLVDNGIEPLEWNGEDKMPTIHAIAPFKPFLNILTSPQASALAALLLFPMRREYRDKNVFKYLPFNTAPSYVDSAAKIVDYLICDFFGISWRTLGKANYILAHDPENFKRLFDGRTGVSELHTSAQGYCNGTPAEVDMAEIEMQASTCLGYTDSNLDAFLHTTGLHLSKLGEDKKSAIRIQLDRIASNVRQTRRLLNKENT